MSVRLSVFFVLIAIIPITIVGILSFLNGRQAIEEEAINHLSSVNLYKENAVISWVEKNMRDLVILAQRPLIRVNAAALVLNSDESEIEASSANIRKVHFEILLSNNLDYIELFIMELEEGRVIVSSSLECEGESHLNDLYFIEGQKDTYFHNLYYSDHHETNLITVTTPLLDLDGNIIAVLAAHLRIDELEKLIKQSSELKASEDTYLVNDQHFFITEPLYGSDYILKEQVYTEGVLDALSGNNGVGYYDDYRGEPIIGAYRYIQQFDMALITEIDQQEAYMPIYDLGYKTLGIAFISALIAAVIGIVFSNRMIRPILKLIDGAAEVGKGNLEHQIPVTGRDEIGELTKTFNTMTSDLRETLISKSRMEELVKERTMQVEASNRELEAFSYSVSHDLRTPLRAVDGFSQILIEEHADKLDQEGLRVVGIIRKNIEQMDQLITDLLTFSKATRTDIKSVTFDMTEMVLSIYEECVPPQDKIDLTFLVELLPHAWGDPVLIRQVWLNLIGNAVKFTRTRDDKRIEIGGYSNRYENVYYIKDNGVGFDSRYTHTIFGVFQRLHKSEQFSGTGIGLAIVQRVVERHHGRVWAEGDIDRGAAFYFALPVKEEDSSV
ncbi:MAG: ATP-binding protein [Bacillota bacterium]|nr:ATP-binding protein [Bacillota bacterium]